MIRSKYQSTNMAGQSVQLNHFIAIKVKTYANDI